MSTDLHDAARILSDARRIVVFTGAGVSAESGIDTFRDAGGLWQQFPPNRFATVPGLLQVAAREPALLARFLHAVIAPVACARPNPGHEAIARLQQFADVTVVTQNIDRLHQDAGNTRVHEIHGTLFDVVSIAGKHLRTLTRADLQEMARALESLQEGVLALPRLMAAVQPLVGLGSSLAHRPRLVLFGEAMAEPDWSMAVEASRSCDAMLVVGTSGEVYPAALLPRHARDNDAPVIGVDPGQGDFDIWLRGKGGEVLPRLLEEMERVKR